MDHTAKKKRIKERADLRVCGLKHGPFLSSLSGPVAYV